MEKKDLIIVILALMVSVCLSYLFREESVISRGFSSFPFVGLLMYYSKKVVKRKKLNKLNAYKNSNIWFLVAMIILWLKSDEIIDKLILLI